MRLSHFGLGKLGLPLAVLFASNALRTVAIAALIERLRAGAVPIVAGLEASVADAASAITYDLRAALRARSRWRYHLVIIASTLLPGTMSTRIVPLLENGFVRCSPVGGS